MNEEDPERDGATLVYTVEHLFRRDTFLRETCPYSSLLRYCLSKVVSTSASEHRTDLTATVTVPGLPAVQVRGECLFGASRGSLPARPDLTDGLSDSD